MLDNNECGVQESDSTIPMLEMPGGGNPYFTIPENPWASGTWEMGDHLFPFIEDYETVRIVKEMGPAIRRGDQLLMTLKMRVMFDVSGEKKNEVKDGLYKVMMSLVDGPLGESLLQYFPGEKLSPSRVTYLIAPDQTVYLAVYTTPDRQTIRVFANKCDAYRWRDEVATKMWSVFYTDNPPGYIEGIDHLVGQEYFMRQAANPVAAESFTIQEQIVEDLL